MTILDVDDYTRYTWIYPLKLKSEALEVFKLFKLQVENQFQTTNKILQSNWGGEYKPFTAFLNECGILVGHSCPLAHHQNGFVERKHRHIVELGLTLLAQSKLPFQFWWDAFHASVYHINRLPTSTLKMSTSYEKLYKHKADYNMLKCFGCACYPYMRDYNKYKFDYHTTKCIFLGYSLSHKGYKCFHPSSHIDIARHVVFDEHSYSFASDPNFHPSNKFKYDTHCTITPIQVFQLSTLPVISDFSVTSNESFSQVYSSGNIFPPTVVSTQVTYQQPSNTYRNNPSTPTMLPSVPDTILDQPSDENSQNQHNNNTSHLNQTVITSPLLNQHPMITRGKAGIFKPKVYATILLHKEPDIVQEAINDER